MLDFYLSEDGKIHLPEINRLAKLDTAKADEKLLHYAMEGIRMAGTFGFYREAAESLVISDNGRDVPVKAGDRIYASFASAAKDPKVFPNPDKVLLDRPIESYLHYGAGPHSYTGGDIGNVAFTAMLKTVGRLDNLRRAPGEQGQLKKVHKPGGFCLYMRADYGAYSSFPTTMKINFDGALPELQDAPGKANEAKKATTTAGPLSQKK
jgi:linoleate 10R-lipoxygenase